MSGKGIDRHLFSLYIVCRGQGYVRNLNVKSLINLIKHKSLINLCQSLFEFSRMSEITTL